MRPPSYTDACRGLGRCQGGEVTMAGRGHARGKEVIRLTAAGSLQSDLGWTRLLTSSKTGTPSGCSLALL
jgi:hypothetical protein